MAIKKIEKQKLDLNVGAKIEFTAAEDTENGFDLDFSAQDERTVVLFTGTSGSEEITIKAGNGIQGVVDLEKFTIGAANDIVAFRLDSGAFKHVTGKHKGYVHAVPSATTVEAAVVVLP